MKNKIFDIALFQVLFLTAVFLLIGGIVPLFSQQTLVSFSYGTESLDYEGWAHVIVEAPSGGGVFYGNEDINSGGIMGLNALFVGVSGFTISAGTDVLFKIGEGTQVDPVFGLGYVYYSNFFIGGIFNIIAKPHISYQKNSEFDYYFADVFLTPTVIAGFDFGYFILIGQLSYMRGTVSGINGYRFCVGVGVNVGRGFN